MVKSILMSIAILCASSSLCAAAPATAADDEAQINAELEGGCTTFIQGDVAATMSVY